MGSQIHNESGPPGSADHCQEPDNGPNLYWSSQVCLTGAEACLTTQAATGKVRITTPAILEIVLVDYPFGPSAKRPDDKTDSLLL
jgi:hypothetical protein